MDFPGPDLLHAFGSVWSQRSRFGRVRLLLGLRRGTLGPLVPDAVTHGFGGVVFAVLQLARLIAAEGIIGEGPRFGDRFGPDFGVVGMERSVEPEEAPPSEEEAVLGQGPPVRKARAR
jgi:hypothetical protein